MAGGVTGIRRSPEARLQTDLSRRSQKRYGKGHPVGRAGTASNFPFGAAPAGRIPLIPQMIH